MKILLNVLCILIVIFPEHGYSENSWREVTSKSAIGSVLGTDLADKLSESLRKEDSSVVYVDISECKVSKLWCSQFEQQFENRLIQNEITFLQQSQKDQIRSRISEELKRQYTSDLVNLDKIVELGKQEAIKAFISIKVTKETPTLFSANAKSVNIKKSVVTISKVSRVVVREKESEYFSQNGWFWSALGLGAGVYLYADSEATQYSNEGDSKYRDYLTSEDPDEIATLREEAEDLDQKSSEYENYATIGKAVAIISAGALAYKILTSKTRYEFKYIANKGTKNNSDSIISKLDTSFLINSNSFGLTFKVEI